MPAHVRNIQSLLFGLHDVVYTFITRPNLEDLVSPFPETSQHMTQLCIPYTTTRGVVVSFVQRLRCWCVCCNVMIPMQRVHSIRLLRIATNASHREIVFTATWRIFMTLSQAILITLVVVIRFFATKSTSSILLNLNYGISDLL